MLKALKVLAVPADIKLNRASYFTSRMRDMNWLEVEFSFTYQVHFGTGHRITDMLSVGTVCLSYNFKIFKAFKKTLNVNNFDQIVKMFE